jgi:hypothetical protein
MKISHTWINESEIEMAWATPSRREIAEAKRKGSKDVLEHCNAPRGWVFADCGDNAADTSDDGGNPGLYLIRA